MADQFIFTMLRLNKFYGSKQVLKDLNLCFYPGAKIGIVGENGSGKSTVLKIMAGLDDDFEGQAQITPGYTSGIVMQDPQLDTELTVRQTIELAFADKVAMVKEYEAVADRMTEPLSDDEMQKVMDRMGVLQDKIDTADAWNIDQHFKVASDALLLPDDDRIIGTLSGGEKRRVALCKALLEKPDLLLLDEPTNHLDAETVDWLETQLRDYPGTVIIVTHDRYFLDNVTRWILELEGSKGIPWEGNYTSWLEQKLTRTTGGDKKESGRTKALKRELAWIRMSSTERHEMSRARLSEYEQLVARETAAKGDGAVIQIAPGPELGDKVIDAKGLCKAFGESVLMKDLDFEIPRSAMVGVIGPNGTGKSTLFKMIMGEEQPDGGVLEKGQTVEYSYVDQEGRGLDPELPLVELIGGGNDDVMLGRTRVPVRQYLSRFGFRGADQQQTVGSLSGGERNRCRLALLLKDGGNVLLLDEPTNDLDVHTLRMLEDALEDYAGSALIISHDRFFLNRVCTHLLVFEGDGQVRWFVGSYQDYEDWRKKEFGTGLFENRRNRYRKLVRG
jgi:energy-dependent translational throttle protein EttA